MKKYTTIILLILALNCQAQITDTIARTGWITSYEGFGNHDQIDTVECRFALITSDSTFRIIDGFKRVVTRNWGDWSQEYLDKKKQQVSYGMVIKEIYSKPVPFKSNFTAAGLSIIADTMLIVRPIKKHKNNHP